MSNYKISVAILGARLHYAVPTILEKNNYLHRMYTDFYIGNKPFVKKILQTFSDNNSLVRKALGRQCIDVSSSKVFSYDFLGLYAFYQRAKAKNGKETTNVQANVNKRFNIQLIKQNFSSSDAIYGFNAASKELFEFLEGISCIRILEQTIAPKRVEQEILIKEYKRWGDIDYSFYVDIDNPIIPREESEWTHSDYIIAPSKFVYNGLVDCGVKETKIHIVPYGVNPTQFKFYSRNRTNKDYKLKVLFAGHVGLRKGVHYLLSALDSLDINNFEVKLAGNITFNNEFLSSYRNKAEFLGRVPRSEMQKLMEWADVFVFPSLCEGSATVIYEALASGLPVICTENSGSLVEDGLDGFIIPVCDSKSISDKLELLRYDYELYNYLYENIKKSKEKVSLQRYERNLIQTINSFVESKK